MSNDYRMVDTDFFSNFPSSCKRISFSDGLQFITVNFQWLITTLLVFNALGSFANFLNHYCTVCSLAVSAPNVLLMLLAVSAVEGNGNPLQYSCLENPGDRGAWWVARPWGRRVGHDSKCLSSSSSSCLYGFTTHFELEF